MAKYCPEKNGQALYTECLECEPNACEKRLFYCLVAGTRGYNDYGEFAAVMDRLLSKQDKKNVVIVSGHCGTGADALAEKYAEEHGMETRLFPADWKRGGKKAGYIRNREMHEYIAKNGDSGHRGVVLFWDMESPGTGHSIGLAEEFGNPVRIFDINRHRFAKKEEKQ